MLHSECFFALLGALTTRTLSHTHKEARARALSKAVGYCGANRSHSGCWLVSTRNRSAAGGQIKLAVDGHTTTEREKPETATPPGGFDVMIPQVFSCAGHTATAAATQRKNGTFCHRAALSCN
uniref:Putative secreted protein n=1 Tax=Anopheles darlingi TaxID=43151 RepID=A0A2M4D7G6_ANODA